MKKLSMILALMVLLIAVPLLSACNQKPTEGPYPADDNAYPGPNTSNSQENPAANTPYPGIDAGNSAQPDPSNPYPDPLVPIPGEENMQRGEVFIEQREILTQESAPPQFVLHLVGNLPTPCHYLRAKVSEPDDQNQIQVEVYSLANSDEVCAQVLDPFDTHISLGSFKTGKYTVLVNGEKVAEIEAP